MPTPASSSAWEALLASYGFGKRGAVVPTEALSRAAGVRVVSSGAS